MSSYFSNFWQKNQGLSFEKPRFSYLNDIAQLAVLFLCGLCGCLGSGAGDAEGLFSVGFVRDGIYRKFALKNEKIMDKNGSICEREKIKILFTEMLDD